MVNLLSCHPQKIKLTIYHNLLTMVYGYFSLIFWCTNCSGCVKTDSFQGFFSQCVPIEWNKNNNVSAGTVK